jgi:hypothetical protein
VGEGRFRRHRKAKGMWTLHNHITVDTERGKMALSIVRNGNFRREGHACRDLFGGNEKNGIYMLCWSRGHEAIMKFRRCGRDVCLC